MTEKDEFYRPTSYEFDNSKTYENTRENFLQCLTLYGVPTKFYNFFADINVRSVKIERAQCTSYDALLKLLKSELFKSSDDHCHIEYAISFIDCTKYVRTTSYVDHYDEDNFDYYSTIAPGFTLIKMHRLVPFVNPQGYGIICEVPLSFGEAWVPEELR